MSTSTLSITDHTGDTRLEWSAEDDAEVAIAKAAFDAAKEKGHLAYTETADGTREIMRTFDASAEKIVMTPQLVGG